MKKLLIGIVLALFLFGSSAIAAPYLEADPQPKAVVGYNLLVNGVEVYSPAVEVDALNVKLRYDLADSPVGANDVSVRANYGVWGESSSVPFPFVRPVIEEPVNMGIVGM